MNSLPPKNKGSVLVFVLAMIVLPGRSFPSSDEGNDSGIKACQSVS